MQLAAAVLLAALASGPVGRLVGIVYASYTAFQYMTEPGFYSLLMSGVEARERSGASALNFVVIFVAQACAASLAGAAIRQFGYSPVLLAAALTAMLAGLALRLLLGARDQIASAEERLAANEHE